MRLLREIWAPSAEAPSEVIPTRTSSHSWVPGWALTQEQQRQGTAQGRRSTWKQSKGWSKKQSWACWCLSFSANRDQKPLLWFRHTQCQPPPSHSHLSPWFMWYLLMGQGWHQNLLSSQRSAWCIWLVGGEKALLYSSDSSENSIAWKEELKHRKNIKVHTEFAELGKNQSSKHTSN